ncbi:MAG: nucleotidyltransferase [Armatimonadota bacterium]
MKLLEYFKDFQDDTVNLNETRLTLLNERVEAITDFLRDSDAFGGNFLDVIPQGSYAHKTIIKPVQDHHEFDADVLLYLEEFDDWDPADYVENLYGCFRASGIYRDNVSRRTRCVTINYAGDFHVDVVPYLERHGEKYITNRHEDNFELTNPEGYNAWLDGQNRIAGRHLANAIRLVKYLRDYKGTFGVKSIILNVLLGQQVNEAALLQDSNCYDDVPTTLRTLMNRLSDYVDENHDLPVIEDPSGTGESFSDRWDQEGYANFRSWIMHYAKKIEDAYTEEDRDESLRKWRVVFGDKFKKSAASASVSSSLVRAGSSLPAVYQKTEQNLADFGILTRVQPKYAFRISGYVLRNGVMGAYYLKDRGNRVRKGRSIRFQIDSCGVPSPYAIYWKVLNRGDEAISNDSIRGEIEQGDRVWHIEEPTSFPGPHYVECYIIKDGICVARDRQDVIIL